MLTVADVALPAVEILLARYGLRLRIQADDEAIEGSYWGGAEAGIVGRTVFVRRDTPVHSLLHETCHIICMSPDRRRQLERDAGGNDLEEAAVCYMQVVLAGWLGEVGATRIMRDMDAWGYTFRLGNTASWFERDAEDARRWLETHGILEADGTPAFSLRR